MPRIPELPNFVGVPAVDDEIPLWDKSADITYGLPIADLAAAVLAQTDPVTPTPSVREDNAWAPLERIYSFAASDEETPLETGDGKISLRMPFAMTLSSVRANLRTASSSGAVTVNIRIGGSDIFGTALTIDANEKTSVTAAVPAVLSTTAVADDAEVLVDIDGAGTGAVGLKIHMIGVAP